MADEWDRLEYEQASEDFRFYVQMGWQATVAVLIGDGIIVGTIASIAKVPTWIWVVPFASAILTLLMLLETHKWTIRTKLRIDILTRHDKARYDQDNDSQERRFYPEETGFPTWKIGKALEALMLFTTIGLFGFSGYLFFQIWNLLCRVSPNGF